MYLKCIKWGFSSFYEHKGTPGPTVYGQIYFSQLHVESIET